MSEIRITNTRNRQKWAEVINSNWRRSIESIIQTGRDLASAKEELPSGEFTKMCREDLDFGPGISKSLMKIASRNFLAQRTGC